MTTLTISPRHLQSLLGEGNLCTRVQVLGGWGQIIPKGAAFCKGRTSRTSSKKTCNNTFTEGIPVFSLNSSLGKSTKMRNHSERFKCHYRGSWD